MNTRIRYVKDHAGNLVSTRIFNNLQVFLNTSSLEFTLKDVRTGTSLATGTATSLNMLKIKAKDSLVSMGVSFEEESRQRVTSA